MLELASIRRVMIIGPPGSGKSTLARALGDLTGLPVEHIDPMFWAHGWVQRPQEETTRRVLAAVAGERWIFDGNHSSTYDARVARAELLIWLDFPTWTCLRRVIQRTLASYGRVRPSMPAGCPERWSPTFLFFVLTYRSRKRPKSARLVERTQGTLAQVVLRNPREVAAWQATWPTPHKAC